ncbi:MAG: DUF4831 family protein [Bacteroidales bacterium]|nr:DUF4831 family protein [Bacteroidales bacterium]
MKSLFVFFFILILAACQSVKVQKLSDGKQYKEPSLIYALPYQQLVITIDAVEKTELVGPFSEFSEQFLEIKPEIIETSTKWEIENVIISTVSKVDTSNLYKITGDIKKIKPENFQWLTSTFGSDQSFVYPQDKWLEASDQEPYFEELTLKKMIIEESETSFKMVTVDSVSKKIPIVNKVIRNKTYEEMAKDAAKTLTKIRKRKFRLISGMNDKLPKEDALKVMLEELDKKEKAYEALFFGKVVYKHFRKVLQVEPFNLGAYNIVFFNESYGFSEDAKKSFYPIVLKLQNANNGTVAVDTIKRFSEKMIPFVVPATINVSISDKQKVIYESNITLSQFGLNMAMPAKYLFKQNWIIDTRTGQFKGFKND